MGRQRTSKANRLRLWTRKVANGYLLRGEQQSTPRGERPSKRIETKKKKKKSDRSSRAQPTPEDLVVEAVLDKIIEEWPLEISDDLINKCTFSVAFKNTFRESLDRTERREANVGRPLQGVQTVRNLLETVDGRNRVFSKFIEIAEEKGSSHLKDAITEGRGRRDELRKIRSHGSGLRRQAVFVPLERASDEEVESMKGKQLVELKKDLNQGLRSGLFSSGRDGPNYVLLDEKVHRICAPTGDPSRAWALILWTKNDANDNEFSEEKIFGGIIYNIEKVSNMFATTNTYSQLQAGATQDFTLKKTAVKRNRTVGGGKMVKGPGPHSVFHIPYDSRFKANMHFETDALQAFMEARYYNFMDGFLPEFSRRLMNAASRSGLLNELGTPRLSTFCTYQYSATSHLDNDDSPTMGWVTKRPATISRSTGNFVWTSHRLLVEMDTNMFWFWDASSDAHGTTISEAALFSGNSQVKGKQIRDNADDGQWTSVFVLPKKVTRAFARK